MDDLKNAKLFFESGKYTCVICKGEKIYTSTKSGIAPLLEWMTIGVKLKGFSAVDKIVGRAAALLFVSAGIDKVYSPIMSENAIEIFLYYGVNAEYTSIVPRILNSNRTEICPMEQAVLLIDSPVEILQTLNKVLIKLQSFRE